MPKRRGVILGLGALAFGSGAVSFAAVNDEVNPDADLQVLSDRAIRVRHIKDSGEPTGLSRDSRVTNANKAAIPSFSDTEFDRENLPRAYASDDAETGDFLFRAGFESNRGGGGTLDQFSDAFVIENTDNVTHEIGISYVDSGGSTYSYGADVADPTSTWQDQGSSTGDLDPAEAQQIWQFQVGNHDADVTQTTGTLLSPDPNSDAAGDGSAHVDNHAGANTVSLDSGQMVGVRVQFDSSSSSVSAGNNLHARINRVAAGSDFRTRAYVDVLNTIWVQTHV